MIWELYCIDEINVEPQYLQRRGITKLNIHYGRTKYGAFTPNSRAAITGTSTQLIAEQPRKDAFCNR